jgi:hypothetical protein
VLARPEPAHWHAWHLACDPEPDGGRYFIDVERIRTAWDVLDWTAHLTQKRWLADTDWFDVVRDIAHRRAAGHARAAGR